MEKLIFFEITDLCNHNCIHCCKAWRTDNMNTMSKEMIDRIISMPYKALTISGGEPSLVREKVFYCINKLKTEVRINTNLTEWKEEDFYFFETHNVELSISVVSMVKKEYEQITLANTFDKFMKNINYASKNSTIVIIVNEHNLDNLYNTVNTLAYKGFTKYIISPQIPNGISFIDIERALEKIEYIYRTKRNLKIQVMSAGMNTCVPYNHRCDAGSGRLVIVSNGNIVPCACFTGHVLGNINNFNYLEAIKKGQDFHDKYSEEEKDICKGVLENV